MTDGADLDRPGRARHDGRRCRRSTATRSWSCRPAPSRASEFALRSRGVPRLQGRGRGDLRAQLVVEVPTKLDDDEAGAAAPAGRQARRAGQPAREGPVLAHQVGVLVGAADGRGAASLGRPRPRRRRRRARRSTTPTRPPPRAGCCACATGRSSRSPTAPVAGGPAAGRRWRCEPDGDVDRRAADRPTVTVAVAPPKGDRLDWLVQKCHRGRRRPPRRCSIAERSVVRWDADRADRQLERLRRIAGEAAMQSRRVWLPELCGPVAGGRVLASTAVAEPGGRTASAPATERSPSGRRAAGRRPSWPLAADRVSLGANVLRVETAAVVAAALMRGGASDERAVRRLRPRPVLLDAVRLLRVRDVDRPPPPRSATTSTPLRRRDPPRGRRRDAGGDERVRRRRHADARAAGRPGRGAAGDPAGARRRGHRRVQPRRRHARRCSRRTSAPASTGCRSACSRWCRTCCACSGARTTRPTSSGPSPRPAPSGCATFNLDLIYGSVGESLDDWRMTLERALALEPPHVSAYALTVEAGHAAGRRPGPPPRRRRAGRRVRARRRPADRRRAGQLRGVELGPARSRVPAQPPVLAPAGLPRASAARPTPTAPGAAGGTCARRSATSTPSRAGRLDRKPPAEALDADDPPVRGPAAVAAHDGRRAASTPSTATTCPASSSGSATAGCSPAAAA